MFEANGKGFLLSRRESYETVTRSVILGECVVDTDLVDATSGWQVPPAIL
jgi:hypothetical protein